MLALIFNLFLFSIAFCNEALLSNIEQLTSPNMGFVKAGEAYFSPEGKMISFQAVPTGEEDYQIFTLNLETKEIVQVSKDAGSCTCSFFHPDGKKIIFAASPEKSKKFEGKYKWDLTSCMNIFEADVDGSQAKALTYGEAYHAECAYSPDGARIVYASNEDGSMNIYIMNSDGTNIKQLTHTTNCYNGGPFFSPDGNTIVFRADRESPDLLQIYMMDTNGDNLVQLTRNEAVNWAPFWHPSGKAIAYTTSIHGHDNYQIYLLNLENGEQQRITYAQVFNGLPSFNREGSKMLWTSKRGPDKTAQVFIADFTLGNP